MKSTTVALVLSALFASTAALAAPPAQPGVAAASEAALPYKGKVVSAIDAGQYTYIEVLQDKKTLWLAAPALALKKGNIIRFEDGAEMSNFHSKTLNRTFPSIRFISQVALSKEKQ
ncbi:MAG: hypothetical protein WA191_00010 [Telluria sp.]|nr:hypothetical protein [Telluria sp.]